MKRLTTMLIIVLAVMSLNVNALAEEAVDPVPSVTLGKYVEVSAEGLPGGIIIEAVNPEDYTETVLVLLETISSIIQQGQSVTTLFKQEELKEMAAVLPEGFDLEKLVASEFIPMNIVGIPAIDEFGENGVIEVVYDIPGEYTEDDVLVAMLGIMGGETTDETADEADITWMPFSARVVDGKVIIGFTMDAFTAVQGKEAVLLILRAR